MELQIPVSKLKPGMYVLDLEGKEGVDASVFSLEGYILTDTEVSDLEACGFKTAFVDPARSRLPEVPLEPGQSPSEFDIISPQPNPAMRGRSVAFRDEYGKAQDLQNESNQIARTIASSAFAGKELPLDSIRTFLSGVVDSVMRNESALLSLAKLKKHEDIIFSHGLNVAILGVAVARQMNFRESFLKDLALAGFLHDIGKLFVPQDLLNYPGKLSQEQFNEIQEHVGRGHAYLQEHSDLPQMIFDGAIDHHERYAGIGYPHGKTGLSISFTGRLLAVVDVYDAISSRRIYRAPMAPPQTLSIMYTDRAQNFTPGFLEVLITTLGVYPPGSLVSLSNQQIGVVVESNELEPLRPKVVLLADARGVRIRPRLIDLDIMRTANVTGPVVRPPSNINPAEAIKQAM